MALDRLNPVSRRIHWRVRVSQPSRGFVACRLRSLLVSDPIAEGLVGHASDRYYVMSIMDMWTNVLGSVGKRATGTKPGNFLSSDRTGRVRRRLI